MINLSPLEAFGETIRSISRISQEIEKMPEFVASRFFEVEFASEVTDEAVNNMYGEKPAESYNQATSAAIIDMAQYRSEKERSAIATAPAANPEVQKPLADDGAPDSLNIDEQRRKVAEVLNKAA